MNSIYHPIFSNTNTSETHEQLFPSPWLPLLPLQVEDVGPEARSIHPNSSKNDSKPSQKDSPLLVIGDLSEAQSNPFPLLGHIRAPSQDNQPLLVECGTSEVQTTPFSSIELEQKPSQDGCSLFVEDDTFESLGQGTLSEEELKPPLDAPCTKARRWTRETSTAKVIEFKKAQEQGKFSQRDFAKKHSIPRTTLQHWVARAKNLQTISPAATFFETPEGLDVLHQIVVAAQFVLTQVGSGGIRLVSLFLKLSGLDLFVASSYGSQQAAITAMEELLGSYGDEERKRLAASMGHKFLLICQDETFHPEICLVAIDPASNYILLEKYAANRDADTWTQAVDEALQELSVTVVQSTSDEAPALLKHVEQGLGAHHSPDLFHVQQDLNKATTLALTSREKKAEESYQKAQDVTKEQAECKANYEASLDTRGPGRPPDFERRIQSASEQEEAALEELSDCIARKETVKEAIRELSWVYHPFSLEDGTPRSSEKVQGELEEQMELIQTLVDEAGLSERSHKLLEKARRVLPKMGATIQFVHQTLLIWLQVLHLPKETETFVHECLVPAFYIQRVAEQTRAPEKRTLLKDRAEKLLRECRVRDGPLDRLEESQRAQAEKVARECSWLFVRSSSCVEGRNGHLELRHRSFHRLSQRKLGALTVLHNFFIERPDGTTAAERFFGEKPKPLFEHLLEKMSLPRRPGRLKKTA